MIDLIKTLTPTNQSLLWLLAIGIIVVAYLILDDATYYDDNEDDFFRWN